MRRAVLLLALLLTQSPWDPLFLDPTSVWDGAYVAFGVRGVW
jgi:hypothetical protein